MSWLNSDTAVHHGANFDPNAGGAMLDASSFMNNPSFDPSQFQNQNQQLQQQEEHERHVASENARYAPLGERTASPAEISEAARRVAEELKRG